MSKGTLVDVIEYTDNTKYYKVSLAAVPLAAAQISRNCTLSNTLFDISLSSTTPTDSVTTVDFSSNEMNETKYKQKSKYE